MHWRFPGRFLNSILNNIWNEFFAGFYADFSAFWAVPKAIQVWGNILKHCRQILDNILASIKNTSSLFLWPMYCHFGRCQRQSGGGKTFWKTANAFWPIFRQALLQNTLPAAISQSLDTLFLWLMAFWINFWQALWQNTLPAAISRSLDPLFLWPMYCHFGRCLTQSRSGKTFWNTADAFWINFRQALLQNTLPAAISQSLDTLFLWPMYCHFGRCQRQSGNGKMFWMTADAFGIILRQALLQNTLPAAGSRFLDTLFLWPMYCHFGPCPTQSGGGKTFWKTADAFWLIFRQAYLQITFLATISLFIGPLFFAADVLPFWVVPMAIRVWGNFQNHFRCILDDFPANISVKYISGNNFRLLCLLLMCSHFGQCQRQSWCGETFGTTSDAFWIIFYSCKSIPTLELISE